MSARCQHARCTKPAQSTFCAEHSKASARRRVAVPEPRPLSVVLVDDGGEPDVPVGLVPRALVEPLGDEVTSSTRIRRAGKVRSPVA